MDRLSAVDANVERYRDVVRRLIEEYARYKPSHGQLEAEAIIVRDHGGRLDTPLPLPGFLDPRCAGVRP